MCFIFRPLSSFGGCVYESNEELVRQFAFDDGSARLWTRATNSAAARCAGSATADCMVLAAEAAAGAPAVAAPRHALAAAGSAGPAGQAARESPRPDTDSIVHRKDTERCRKICPESCRPHDLSARRTRQPEAVRKPGCESDRQSRHRDQH